MLNSETPSIVQVPRPTLLETFRNYNENTMNQYTNASVGALLLRLADIYLPKASEKTEQNAAEIEKYVDESIAALKAKLTALKNDFQTSDDELNAVLAYIDHLIQQPLNELDNLTVFKNGKAQTHQISLKQVLALVFRALTDKKIFELTTTSNSKAEKDQDEDEDENNRLFTLYNTLNKLRKGKVDGTNFCHTGVRNDITCSLNHIYPDVRIIEQIDTAISMVLQDFVLAKLKKEKPTQQFQLLFHQLRDNVSSEETNDFQTWVADNQFKKEAKECLEHFCLENGLNPDDAELAKMINNNLLGLSSLPAPLSIHPQAPYLEILVTFAYTDKTLPQAARAQLQAELNSLTYFEDIETKGLLHRLKAVQLWRTVKAYENIPIIGTEEQEFADAVKALLNFLLNYFQQANQASTIESATIQQYITIIEAHEKKKLNREFVANFFEFWTNADSIEAKITLRNRLLVEKPKLLLSDADLNHFFNQHAENNIVSIEPFHINLILLHAMLCPVADWTPTFHACLTRIIAFIKNNFRENSSSAASFIATNLRRNSYPDRFLKWFVVLQKLYLKVKQNEGPHFKVASDAIQVWMLDETKKLNLQNWLAVIEVMGDEIVRVIQDNEQLFVILEPLDQNAQLIFLKALGHQVAIIIGYFILLAKILVQLDQNVWPALFNAMGAQVQTIISDGRKLAQLLLKFSNPESRSALINAIGPLVQIFIKDAKEFRLVLRPLDQNTRSILIRLLGTQLQNIINDSEDIACTLEMLDPNFYGDLIDALGDKFKIIIRDNADLFLLLRQLNPINRRVLIKILGPHLRTVIRDGYQLARVLEALDQKSKHAIMNILDIHVQTIIQNGLQLARVLKEFDQNNKLALIKVLGSHVQTIIQNGDQLASVLASSQDQNERLYIIKSLGIYIQTIIQDPHQLATVLKQFEENDVAQLTCLVLLDKKEFVESINPKNTAMSIYANHCRFAKDKTPLQASRDILENYAQPELLGVFKLEVRDITCLIVVREAVNDKTIDSIDAFLTKITKEIPLAKIKECDTSLYQQLQFICALNNKPLDKYVATIQQDQHAHQFNVSMG